MADNESNENHSESVGIIRTDKQLTGHSIVLSKLRRPASGWQTMANALVGKTSVTISWLVPDVGVETFRELLQGHMSYKDANFNRIVEALTEGHVRKKARQFTVYQITGLGKIGRRISPWICSTVQPPSLRYLMRRVLLGSLFTDTTDVPWMLV